MKGRTDAGKPVIPSRNGVDPLTVSPVKQDTQGGVCESVLFVRGGSAHMWSGSFVWKREEGGREAVAGVRFTLVRLAPLDIPDIPTSGMFEAPPSSSLRVGGCRGLSCCRAHTDGLFWLNRNRPPLI